MTLLIVVYSSSESDGGIMPTLESSSSESSGYAEDFGNSFGLERNNQ